jgi:hypothetical protein
MCGCVLYGIKRLLEDVAGMGSWLVFTLISVRLYDCTCYRGDPYSNYTAFG